MSINQVYTLEITMSCIAIKISKGEEEFIDHRFDDLRWNFIAREIISIERFNLNSKI